MQFVALIVKNRLRIKSDVTIAYATKNQQILKSFAKTAQRHKETFICALDDAIQDNIHADILNNTQVFGDNLLHLFLTLHRDLLKRLILENTNVQLNAKKMFPIA